MDTSKNVCATVPSLCYVSFFGSKYMYIYVLVDCLVTAQVSNVCLRLGLGPHPRAFTDPANDPSLSKACSRENWKQNVYHKLFDMRQLFGIPLGTMEESRAVQRRLQELGHRVAAGCATGHHSGSPPNGNSCLA